jgi:hypothetical protein
MLVKRRRRNAQRRRAMSKHSSRDPKLRGKNCVWTITAQPGNSSGSSGGVRETSTPLGWAQKHSSAVTITLRRRHLYGISSWCSSCGVVLTAGQMEAPKEEEEEEKAEELVEKGLDDCSSHCHSSPSCFFSSSCHVAAAATATEYCCLRRWREESQENHRSLSRVPLTQSGPRLPLPAGGRDYHCQYHLLHTDSKYDKIP